MIKSNEESANPGQIIPCENKRKNKTKNKANINEKLNFERELKS